MEIIKVTPDNGEKQIFDIISKQKETCIFCIVDRTVIVAGIKNDVNIDIAKQNNIQILHLQNEGGTIVAAPGTVGLAFFTKDFTGHEYRDKVISTVISQLKKNGYEPTLDKNDVLINNKKIMSSSSHRYGDLLFTAILFSINTPDINLIKQICTKPMKKIPGDLNDYGITSQDIENIIYDIFNNI